MNKRECERLNCQENTLMSLGFTQDETIKLRRISNTLRRWYELECGIDGGCIDRDDTSGLPYWINSTTNSGHHIPDREKGAEKRLAAIMTARDTRCAVNSIAPAHLDTYLQTDPRGAALYILRPGDVPAGADPSAYYSRGICVY